MIEMDRDPLHDHTPRWPSDGINEFRAVSRHLRKLTINMLQKTRPPSRGCSNGDRIVWW